MSDPFDEIDGIKREREEQATLREQERRQAYEARRQFEDIHLPRFREILEAFGNRVYGRYELGTGSISSLKISIDASVFVHLSKYSSEGYFISLIRDNTRSCLVGRYRIESSGMGKSATYSKVAAQEFIVPLDEQKIKEMLVEVYKASPSRY